MSRLNVRFSGLITSIGEERADFSNFDYLFSKVFPFPFGALDRHRHLIVALHVPSIYHYGQMI